MHRQMTALASELVRSDLRAVQRVGDLHAERKRFGRIAFVRDLRAVCRPDDRIAVAGERLVAGKVFNVGQTGNIVNFGFSRAVVKTLAHDDLIGIAVCVREYIDNFFLIDLCHRARRNGQQHGERNQRRPNALCIDLHISFPPF